MSVRDAFEEFHSSSPDVYTSLVRMARTLKARGRERCSFRMIWEIVRFKGEIRTKKGEKYALNNNYCPMYIRLIESQEPDLAGFFPKRGAKCDQPPVDPTDEIDWNFILG